MKSGQWMIYGANGYSGRLIAERAKTFGFEPILAGRNQEAVQTLADDLNLNWRAFDLEEPDVIQRNLADMDAVIHCAGPFSQTSEAMIQSCLQAKTHYFDISGEIDVFEAAHRDEIHSQAKASGIIVCPGIGFDVVPTDCLALKLAERMPDATHLDLGFASRSAMSPGTAKTMVEGLGLGVRRRVDGQIVQTKPEERHIDFGSGTKLCTLLSWGDVSTAYYTTGIPNISVYIPVSKRALRSMVWAHRLRPFLKLGPVQSFLKSRAGKQHGPSAESRSKATTQVWGEVRNASGKSISLRMKTLNGYDVTALCPVLIMKRLQEDRLEYAGSTTPAQLLGPDFVLELEGTEFEQDT